MISSLDELLSEFKVENDVVGLWQIARAIREFLPGRSEKEVARITLDFVRGMLAAGFKAGCSPYSSTGFAAWAVQSPDEVVARIEREWREDEKTSDLEGVWFLPPAMNN